MSKVTKKELKKQLDGVQNRFAALVKDLKASGHICESVYAPFAHDYQKEQSDHDAVIVILDSKEPQLKQLDQSIFDGLDEKWVAASVEEDGTARIYMSDENNPYDCEYHLAGTNYDTSNWQNSLIERESKELTGSDLCRAMLARGDKFVLCKGSEISDIDAIKTDWAWVATHALDEGGFDASDFLFEFLVPINNQGEPLTAKEVGL